MSTEYWVNVLSRTKASGLHPSFSPCSAILNMDVTIRGAISVLIRCSRTSSAVSFSYTVSASESFPSVAVVLAKTPLGSIARRVFANRRASVRVSAFAAEESLSRSVDNSRGA